MIKNCVLAKYLTNYIIQNEQEAVLDMQACLDSYRAGTNAERVVFAGSTFPSS